MQIGGKEYSEITITDSQGGLLVSITDEDIIAEKDCRVVCVPNDAKPKVIAWASEYTRIIVETDEENPVTVAVFTGDDMSTADGYRLRMKPRYD